MTPSARDVARALGVTLSGAAAERVGATVATSRSTPESVRVQSRSFSRRSVVIGADHGGVAMKDAIAKELRGQGYTVEDVGTTGSDPVDYPDFAYAVAREVAAGRVDAGIMIDGAGIGSCMAANKVPGVRAAMCYDVTTATNAREHNNANVLTLGASLIGPRLALEIVKVFLSTEFAGGRHERRVAKLMG